MSETPVAIGMTGLGGYAGAICRVLRENSRGDNALLRLAAVCEPDLATHAALVNELRAEGVFVTAQWDELLAQPLEAVWLPLPIPLHYPYTEQALAAGLAVMCEKPAAGCVQDLDAMRAARDKFRLPVAIGFQDIYEPSTAQMKSLLLAGKIGPVRSATLSACWPRDNRYYARSSWAGRQKQGETWVMDSPASNALAHFVNLALFLMGPTAQDSAELRSVEAELYRANPIENYDTCGLRITTANDAPLLVLLTHACHTGKEPRIVIHGERGTLTYQHGGGVDIHTPDGTESLPLQASRDNMAARFAHLVRGAADDRFVATLEIARTHLAAVNGASEASPVHSIPSPFVEEIAGADGQILRAVPGIEELFIACVRDGRLPHETGLAAWTSPAGTRDLRNYSHFSGPAQE